MVDSKRYQDWFDKAQKDLKSAKILVESGEVNDIVAFHCQQAIEKAFKGFLVARRGMVIEGHSLLKLFREVKNETRAIPDFTKDCAFVNQYYIETRYPSDDPLEVTDEEAVECISIAEAILHEIRQQLSGSIIEQK